MAYRTISDIPSFKNQLISTVVEQIGGNDKRKGERILLKSIKERYNSDKRLYINKTQIRRLYGTKNTRNSPKGKLKIPLTVCLIFDAIVDLVESNHSIKKSIREHCINEKITYKDCTYLNLFLKNYIDRYRNSNYHGICLPVHDSVICKIPNCELNCFDSEKQMETYRKEYNSGSKEAASSNDSPPPKKDKEKKIKKNK
jgi:hypothetical protein